MEQKNELEYRSYLCSVETREDDNHGKYISGVPIVFGQRTNIDFFDEIIEPGALNNADMRDVRFLVNHDKTQIPLARSRNNNENSTMQLSVKEDGLHIRANLDTENNARAKELWSAVDRGDVSGMSFMFTVRTDEWTDLETDHPVRHITAIDRIFEVSAVTWPVYEGTSISARSLDSVRSELESAKEELESSRKTEELRRKVIERSSKDDKGAERNNSRA